MANYWIGVASLDHIRKGVEGGFAQLGHGRHVAVKALKKGDWIAYYAPRAEMGKGAPVRAFCSLGQITSEEPYQARMSDGFTPYRVDVAYRRSAKPAEIAPLLDRLHITRELGSRWGMVMRRGRIRIDAEDFALIAEAMGTADPT